MFPAVMEWVGCSRSLKGTRKCLDLDLSHLLELKGLVCVPDPLYPTPAVGQTEPKGAARPVGLTTRGSHLTEGWG